ncbi:MAG: preprotein translocase subunit SecG [Bacteroidota bacterium]|nr:preprotein translocase subunit SecG [Bacteroidota bacterium]
MFTLSSILIIIASIVMILIVLAQNSKGGGLSSTFGGGGSQVAGVQQTNKFLDKATWTIALALLVFSVTASLTIANPELNQESVTNERLNKLNETPGRDILAPDQVESLKENNQPKKEDE